MESSTQLTIVMCLKLSDFPALVFLAWGSVVDVIGVVAQHTPIQQAKGGTRDFYVAMRIVDSSRPQGIVMRIFRPYEEALPQVEVGDVVLLRSFVVGAPISLSQACF